MTIWKKLLAAVGLGTEAAVSQAGTPLLDPTPDLPEALGYKVKWFAMKTDDSSKVIEALGLGEGAIANWRSGLHAAYGKAEGAASSIFVSPPIDGWVFAIGSDLPYPGQGGDEEDIIADDNLDGPFHRMFRRLAERFDDVQFFGSYRVVGFVTWARAKSGEIERMFAYADGQVLANAGKQSPEEQQLGFADLTGLSLDEAINRISEVFEQHDAEQQDLVRKGRSPREALAECRRTRRDPVPDEEDVVKLASLWSINPENFPLPGSSLGTGTVIGL